MGYFSNGSEGDGYYETYCERCIHCPSNDEAACCPVWFLHLEHNYSQLDKGQEKLREALSFLIPPDSKVGNGQCRMFVERKDDAH